MQIFNPAPSITELSAMARRNIAAREAKRFVRDDIHAEQILLGCEFPDRPLAYGFPSLLTAANFFTAHNQPQIPRVMTFDTDGPVCLYGQEGYDNHGRAIKDLIPAFRPQQLPEHMALDGLAQFRSAFQEGMLRFLGISVSSGRLPRQPLVREMFQEHGADEYLCGLQRDKIPDIEYAGKKPKGAQLNVWQQFLDAMKRIGDDFKALQQVRLEYGHVFDDLPPIRPMAFMHGEEGLFSGFVSDTLIRLGFDVNPLLVSINTMFPPEGMVMGQRLVYEPLQPAS